MDRDGGYSELLSEGRLRNQTFQTSDLLHVGLGELHRALTFSTVRCAVANLFGRVFFGCQPTNMLGGNARIEASTAQMRGFMFRGRRGSMFKRADETVCSDHTPLVAQLTVAFPHTSEGPCQTFVSGMVQSNLQNEPEGRTMRGFLFPHWGTLRLSTVAVNAFVAVVFCCGLATSASGRDVVSQAERYLGTNPTGWAHNWCAEFLNRFVLHPLGFMGSGSAASSSFLAMSRAVPSPGVIVVLPHHVAIVKRFAGRGRIQIVSGNWGHRVAYGTISMRMVIAFVRPRRFR